MRVDSAVDAIAVTPHDTNPVRTDGRPVRFGLWVGGVGNVTLITAKGNTVLFTAVPAGTFLPIQFTHVKLTATTATLMVALI